MNEPTSKPFALTLEKREKAVLTGVTDVERFDESEVVLHTHGGRLTLTGTGLHVSSLQLEEGRLLVDGAHQELSTSETTLVLPGQPHIRLPDPCKRRVSWLLIRFESDARSSTFIGLG